MLEKQEFEQILKREDIKNFLLNSSKEAIEKAFGEKVANMKDYDQNNPNHQYDLLEHTIEVMEGLPKEKYLPEDYKTLRIAAFFHDIGKPEVAKEKDGKTVYYRHAEKSKEISVDILQEMGYTESEIDRILFFVQHHDDFINVSTIDDKTVEKVSKILEKMKSAEYVPTNKDQMMLLDLCRADVQAQSEVIEENGEIKDTRKDRLDRYNKIEALLPEARVYKQVKDIEDQISRCEKELEKLTTPPNPIVKQGRTVNQKQLDMWNEWASKPEEEREGIIGKIQSDIEDAKRRKSGILDSINQEIEQ